MLRSSAARITQCEIMRRACSTAALRILFKNMINTERLVKTFVEIAAIDSPTGQEVLMAEYLISIFTQLNFSPTKDSFGNVHIFVSGVGEPIILCAHMDVVQPCIGVKPQIRDGYIVSDGTTVLGADNKVAVAAIIECVQTMVEKNVTLRPLDIVFTCSEEVGNEGAIHFDYSLLRATHGFSFDSGEKFGTIILGSPFYERFDVTFNGVGTHASRPETGVNALAMVRDALQAIPLGRPSETCTCNIGVIDGGKARNAVPGSVVIRGEVRSFVETEIIEKINSIRAACVDAAEKNGGTVTIETVRENGGFLYTESHPQVVAAARGLESVGLQPMHKIVFGCFDANIFSEHKIDLVNISHGAEFSHGVTERMSLENLSKLGNLVWTLVQSA